MKYPSITSAEDIPAALRDMRLSAMAAAFEEGMKKFSTAIVTISQENDLIILQN